MKRKTLTPPCQRYIRAINKNNHMWHSTRWVDEHIVLDLVLAIIIGIRIFETIASYILHSIRKDVAYPVKHTQTYIKYS